MHPARPRRGSSATGSWRPPCSCSRPSCPPRGSWRRACRSALPFAHRPFAPRWLRWITPLWAAWVVGFFALAPVLAPRGTWLVALTFVLWIGWFGTGVLAQTYRYVWTGTPMQREQTKWVVLGLSLIDPGHPSLLHVPHKPL